MAKIAKKPEKFEVKCLQTFRDKHTLKIHKKGEVFNVTEERFAEILKVGKFVEKHTEKAEKAEK